jgi:hypothetical protein
MTSLPLFAVRGQDCELAVFQDRVIIRPTSLIGFIRIGIKVMKTIPFASITSVQHKKPGMGVGYLQFSIKGASENRAGVFAAATGKSRFRYVGHSELIERITRHIEQRLEAEAATAAPVSMKEPADASAAGSAPHGVGDERSQ